MDWGNIIDQTVRQLFGPDAVYFIIAAIGLNVQFGYCGLLNFGQAAFLACGAYGMGMTVQYFAVSPWWGLVFGFLFAIALGLLMGIPTLRLRADYLAIVTIATAEVIRLTVRSVRFKQCFNGSDGINGFADGFYASKGWLIGRINPQTRYRFWRFSYTGRELRVMVVGWILIAVLSIGVWLLMRSPWGRV